MPIRFTDDVKGWQKRAVRKYCRIFGLEDWTIEVGLADEDVLGEQVHGICDSLPQYLTATITLHETDVANDDRGLHVIAHECRHPHYEAVTQLFSHLWDGRRKVDRATAQKMLESLIEELVERDIQMLRRLKQVP